MTGIQGDLDQFFRDRADQLATQPETPAARDRRIAAEFAAAVEPAFTEPEDTE